MEGGAYAKGLTKSEKCDGDGDWAQHGVAHDGVGGGDGGNGFKNRNGGTFIETQHRFDDLVNECTIQAIVLSKAHKSAAFLMRPCAKSSHFMEVYTTMERVPSIVVIFRAMKAVANGNGVLLVSGFFFRNRYLTTLPYDSCQLV